MLIQRACISRVLGGLTLTATAVPHVVPIAGDAMAFSAGNQIDRHTLAQNLCHDLAGSQCLRFRHALFLWLLDSQCARSKRHSRVEQYVGVFQSHARALDSLESS